MRDGQFQTLDPSTGSQHRNNAIHVSGIHHNFNVGRFLQQLVVYRDHAREQIRPAPSKRELVTVLVTSVSSALTSQMYTVHCRLIDLMGAPSIDAIR